LKIKGIFFTPPWLYSIDFKTIKSMLVQYPRSPQALSNSSKRRCNGRVSTRDDGHHPKYANWVSQVTGKKNNTKKTKRAAEKESAEAKTESADRPPPPLFDRHGAMRLSKAIGNAAKRLGIPAERGIRIHDRLFYPLRILALLHRECEAVLRHDSRAAKDFLLRLDRLAAPRDSPDDRIDKLRGPAAAHNSCNRPYPGSQLVSFEAIAPLYQAAFIASGGDSKALNRAFSRIVRFSRAELALESLHHSLTTGGQGAVSDQMAWGLAFARGPFCSGGMPDASPVIDPGDGGWGEDPDGDPWGGGPQGDPWGGIPGGWNPPDFGGLCDDPPWPPIPEEGSLRLGCEGMLIDIFNAEAPSLRLLGRRSAWADNIENIELEGSCGGDWMVIQGQGFGDTQPDNVALIAHTDQGCRELEVEADNWSATEIRVRLPDGILSGPVGFYDRLATNAFNAWIGEMNASAARILSASACLGKPLVFPTLHTTLAIPCPPQTGVNRIAVGLPIIHYFNGSAGEAAAERVLLSPNQTLELTWDVENASSLTLTRVTAAGPDIPGGYPFGVQQYLPVTGSSAITLEPSTHIFIETASYRLRAENDCGHVDSFVRVLLTRRPELEIVDIEVTQGMQTADGEVALVAGKQTVVRLIGTHAMAEIGQASLPGVWGRIRYFNDEFPEGTGWDAPINNSLTRPPEPDFGARIDLPTNPNLGVTNHTVNFLIPETLCQGSLDIEVELRVYDAGGSDEFEGYGETVRQRFDGFEFRERKPIRIRYIPVTVEPDATATLNMAPGISNPPTDQECRELIEESLQQIPARAESIARHDSYSIRISLDRTIIETPFGEFSRSLGYDIFGNAHLEWIRIIRICAFIDITGLLCPEDDDAYWAIIVPSDGGWGRAHIGGREYLTPYRASTAAHELAHCLNQQHLGVACPNGSSAPGGEDPADFENGGVVTGVPFDILNNRAGSINDFDLMTYCNNRWVSAQRWQQIFDFVGPP
jgi:hypothetical protein